MREISSSQMTNNVEKFPCHNVIMDTRILSVSYSTVSLFVQYSKFHKYSYLPGPLSPTWFNFNKLITSSVDCGMKFHLTLYDCLSMLRSRLVKGTSEASNVSSNLAKHQKQDFDGTLFFICTIVEWCTPMKSMQIKLTYLVAQARQHKWTHGKS